MWRKYQSSQCKKLWSDFFDVFFNAGLNDKIMNKLDHISLPGDESLVELQLHKAVLRKHHRLLKSCNFCWNKLNQKLKLAKVQELISMVEKKSNLAISYLTSLASWMKAKSLFSRSLTILNPSDALRKGLVFSIDIRIDAYCSFTG